MTSQWKLTVRSCHDHGTSVGLTHRVVVDINKYIALNE